MDILDKGLSGRVNERVLASQQTVVEAHIFGEGQDSDVLIGRVARVMALVDGFCCVARIAAAGQCLQIKRGVIGGKADSEGAIQR